MLEQEVDSPRSRIGRSRGWDWRRVLSESFGSGAASAGTAGDSGESLEGVSQAPASRWGPEGRTPPLAPSVLVRERPAPAPLLSRSAIGGSACRSEGAEPLFSVYLAAAAAAAAVLLAAPAGRTA